MPSRDRYQIRVTPDAAKQIRGLDGAQRTRLDDALHRLASDSESTPGTRGGKSLKRIRGRRDRFFRLRVGDMRVVFEILKKERVLLVAGVLNRRDLERWPRDR